MGPSDDPDRDEPLTLQDVRDSWPAYDDDDRVAAFRSLTRPEAEDFFLDVEPADEAWILRALRPEERRSWIRMLAPDDVADVLQAIPAEERPAYVALLDETTQKDVAGLLAFAEDDAGGLMHPRYVRIRPDLSVDEAITYLRKASREKVGTLYYAYVLDPEGRLLGVVSLRELFVAAADKKVRDVMQADPVVADETMDQEALARLFKQHRLFAIPVVDATRTMKGIVTFDDIGAVLEEEATEDIQKIGGTEALTTPYMRTPFLQMVRKRAGWLSVLFVGELLTVATMGRFEDKIRAATVLSLFIPLIISSGGNSGSQAATLVIRALALGEVTVRDWWRVIRRELASGVTLGLLLAPVAVGFILLLHTMGLADHTDHFVRVALVVALSIVGVVTWGTLAGSMLPLVLHRLRFDPASASAPFVATLVDVTGLMIYFSLATLLLTGRLL